MSEPSELIKKPGAYSGPAPSKDEINLALLIYVSSLFTTFVVPLVIWLMKKDQSPFIDDQGKELLNWVITLGLGAVACVVLAFLIIPMFLLPLFGVAHMVFTILGALKAKEGIAYRYPFAIRLLK